MNGDTKRLLIGVGRANITPPVGTALVGYGIRTGPSTHIHDDLFATALVLADGERNVAIVAVDLCAITSPEVDEIRESIGALLGESSANVMIACSHTHAGPVASSGFKALVAGDGHLEPRERAYADNLRNQLLGAVAEAKSRLVEGRMAVGKGSVQIGINRRERLPDGRVVIGHNPEGPTDPEVGVARFDDSQGRPIACLVNYACHATTMGPQNLAISADYPGAMRRVVERNTGALCLFLAGAGANVAPRRSISDNFEHVERQGTVLGLEAAKVFHSLETRRIWQSRVISETEGLQVIWTDHVEDGPSVEHIGAAVRAVELPLQELPDRVSAERMLQRWERTVSELEAAKETGAPMRFAWRQLNWARRVLAEVQAGRRKGAATVELQVIRVNDLALVGIPAEPFVEIGLAIKAGSRVVNTFPVGYANGYLTYVPWPDAYAEGGYEVNEAFKGTMVAGPAEESARLIVDACLELVKSAGAKVSV